MSNQQYMKCCAPIQEYRDRQDAFGRLLTAIYGDDLTQEEIEAHKSQQLKKMCARKQNAVHAAMKQLHRLGRPICLFDMYVAIEKALIQAVKQYEHSCTQDNAVHLLSLLLCRNTLLGEADSESNE